MRPAARAGPPITGSHTRERPSARPWGLVARALASAAVAVGAACSTAPPSTAPASPDVPPASAAVASATSSTAARSPAPPESSSVDLRALMTPVKDQGDRMACAHFAVAAQLEALLKAKVGRDVDLSEEYLIVSEKALGSARRETATVPDVYEAVVQRGLLLEQDWAYQPSWFARGLPGAGLSRDDPTAPAACFSHDEPPPDLLARRLPVTIRSTGYTRGLARVMKHLRARRPLVTCFRLPALPDDASEEYPPGWPASGDVRWDEARYPDAPHHFVLVTGFDLERGVLLFKNSWGTGWGRAGYGTVPFDLVERLNPEFFVVKDADVGALPAERPTPAATDLAVTCARRLDGALDVRVTGRVSHLAGRHLIVRAELLAARPGATPAAVLLPDRECASFLPFTRPAATGLRSLSAVWHHRPAADDDLTWSDDGPLRLDLPVELLQAAAQAGPLVVRAEALVHTDDVGFRRLAWTDVPVP